MELESRKEAPPPVESSQIEGKLKVTYHYATLVKLLTIKQDAGAK